MIKRILLTLALLALPWQVVGAQGVVEETCRMCTGACIPDMTPTSFSDYGFDDTCINTQIFTVVCRITGKSFMVRIGRCDRIVWALNYTHLRRLDSLYRASQMHPDIVYVDSSLLYRFPLRLYPVVIPDSLRNDTSNPIVFTREVTRVPLDSVAVLKCKFAHWRIVASDTLVTQYLDRQGLLNTCDTTAWRITRWQEIVTEWRVK